MAAEGNAIRIGTQGTQTQTYIGRIKEAPVTGSRVVNSVEGVTGAWARVSMGRLRPDEAETHGRE